MTLHHILAQYKTLTADGFRDPASPDFSKWRRDLIDRTDYLEPARQWVSQFGKAKTHRASAYAIKHVMERDTGVYVTEGAFIVSALMEGFTMDEKRRGFLNIDRRDLDRYLKRREPLERKKPGNVNYC